MCPSDLPHSSAKSVAERDEEVRLAYVAITRAADRLVLTHALSRRGRDRTRSPFVDGADTRRVGVPPTEDFVRGAETRRSHPSRKDLVLAELRAWRESAARASLIDVRAVCTDETLARIADAEPSTEDELADIEGVGQMLARRAGSRILDAIRRGVSQSTDFADD